MAVPPLRALVAAGHEIALCVTRPDRKRGRGGELSPSPVKAAALELGLPVTHSMDDLLDADVELGVVVAFGRIIPVGVLDRVPMLNLHFSLLPRWRGAAPVERALLAGDAETGVCLMKVEEGLDTGPIYDVRRVTITPDLDLGALRRELVQVGSDMLVEALAGGVATLPEPRPQVGPATMAEKVTKEDLHLGFENDADTLQRIVRLGQAWTTFRGRRLRVLQARAEPDAHSEVGTGSTQQPGTLVGTGVCTGRGVLRLERVQPESRSPMSAEEWIRGVRPLESERLGSD
jgi:methionyl-tRNA formyltransferase